MTRSWPALTLVLLALLIPVGGTPAQTADAPARTLGMEPLAPALAAPDFTLTDTEGSTRSLSDYRGQWVLLTFWATWCGPCRSEMPSLQRLSEEYAGRGLAVVGVVVGSDPGNARDFVHRHGLTFPSLLDTSDAVGAAYRASSIPLTYLVDPDGRLVGIARGARDWAAASAAVGRLIGGHDGTATASSVPAPRSAEPLALPADLIPPTGRAELPAGQVRVGESAELWVHVDWDGDPDQYTLLTPQLTLPPGLEQASVGASSSSLDGIQRVTYTFQLDAVAAGDYPLDPIELRFTPLGRSAPLYTRLAGPTLGVIDPPARWPWIVAGVVVLGCVGVGVGWVRRRGP